MSRVDSLTGRGPSFGNTRSHSLRATRRRWNVNLQTVTIEINGKKQRVRVSTKTLKTLRHKANQAAAKKAAAAPAVEETKAAE